MLLPPVCVFPMLLLLQPMAGHSLAQRGKLWFDLIGCMQLELQPGSGLPCTIGFGDSLRVNSVLQERSSLTQSQLQGNTGSVQNVLVRPHPKVWRSTTILWSAHKVTAQPQGQGCQLTWPFRGGSQPVLGEGFTMTCAPTEKAHFPREHRTLPTKLE